MFVFVWRKYVLTNGYMRFKSVDRVNNTVKKSGP